MRRNTRTRIARLAAASAVVVSLGALTAGPAAAQGTDIGSTKPRLAQSGKDIGSGGASVGWAVVKSSAVTFGDDGSPAFTLGLTLANDEPSRVRNSNPPCTSPILCPVSMTTASADETSFTWSAGEGTGTNSIGRGSAIKSVEDGAAGDASSVTF